MQISHNSRLAVAASTVTITGLVLAACGGSDGGTNAAGEGLLSQIESGHVTIGTKYDQVGLGLREASGEVVGFDVDVAKFIVEKIAENNGWETPEIEWRETPSAQRETLIGNSEVDMIAATYSINPSRSESVNFGGPYLLTHQALLVSDDDKDIKGMEDLDGKILCSVTGSTPAQTVKEEIPGVQLQEFDTYSSCVEALRQGTIDAITTDATILNGYSAQSPGDFRVVEMKKDGKDFTDEYYGIGLAKGDDEGTAAINEALEALYEEGKFQEFLDANLDGGSGVTEATPGDLSFLES